MQKVVFIFIWTLILQSCFGQRKKQYSLKSIVFYNVENLFDTIDDPNTADDSHTPLGSYRWSHKRYNSKLDRIAYVINNFRLLERKVIPDIIGICEVENRKVLEDLVIHPELIRYKYGIIHHNSPDRRGIDVGLLYRKSSFQPITFQSHRLVLFNENDQREYTRDQLVVGGLFDTEKLYFIVNHWPSRSGGEEKTKPYRLAAARLTKRIIDSICEVENKPKFVIMGDFNDNPTDDSILNILKYSEKERDNKRVSFYNPMMDLYKRGVGSLAYRDHWNLFDQIIISQNLVSQEKIKYSFLKAGVFSSNFLITSRGRFKGYPFRSYVGGSYQGGYSDHLPVYMLLIRDLD